MSRFDCKLKGSSYGKLVLVVIRGSPGSSVGQAGDLAVAGSSPAGGGNVYNRKYGSIAYSLSLSHTHRHDMTELLLNRTKNCKSSIHTYIVLESRAHNTNIHGNRLLKI